MKKHIKNLSVFVAICAVITVLLAATNWLTAPIIEKNQNAAANAALLEVMPNGKGFESVDISKLTLPKTVTEVFKETDGQGYVIKLSTTGYGTNMVIMCGVSSDGVVTGAVCLSSNETLGVEKTYGTNFTDKNMDGVAETDTISGATKTTAAYKNAISDALNTAVILGGGEVDIRTPEEILADNLAAAFPDGEGKFEKLFLVEDIVGYDAIYTATNGKGYVFVKGEQFIGVNADGSGVQDAAISDSVAKIKATVLTDVAFDKFTDLAPYILSAKKTESGNYVFETKGAGYGIKGGDEWHPASNEFIVVRVSMTADGRIIDCLTVSQAETQGLGDACATPEFYGQFVGKDKSNYTEIDAISKATMTTDGYKQAIERAYNLLNAVTGGN